ncbi:hypothetical protein L0244_34180, partial [bacterium]|nr:hypothetical protein [bacterium]
KRTGRGVVVLMPRYLNYSKRRTPTFQKYLNIRHRIHSKKFLKYEGDSAISFLVDPTSPNYEGDHLGLFFHKWIEDGQHSSS